MLRSDSCRTKTRLVPFFLAAALFAVTVCVVTPTAALARSYEISRVDITAQVSADGTLDVYESRTFDFDGQYNGVYWDIPVGYNSSNGKQVNVEVVSAKSGKAELSESSSGDNNTYSVSTSNNVERLKIYSSHEDESDTFTIHYRATGIVTRWEDTAEIYWKFVSDGWDVESTNVTCTLTLPVPSGESVTAGDNVRAWGHGPLDANVSFADNGNVVFEVPGVGTEEYAEMRVTFPTSWVSSLEQTSGSRLSTILSDEQSWSDQANQKRSGMRVGVGVGAGVGLLLALAAITMTVKTSLGYRKGHTSQFQDKYFRDVPSADHPAVLGALYNGGKAQGKELTATLMGLTEAHVLTLEQATIQKRGMFGKIHEEQTYRLTKVGELDEGAESRLPMGQRGIDDRALDLFFDRVARSGWGELPTVTFDEVETYARECPISYEEGYEKWTSIVEVAYTTRFADVMGPKGKTPTTVVGVIASMAGIAEIPLMLLLKAPEWMRVVVPLVMIACGVIAIVSSAILKGVNPEAVETLARLKALRRWLNDFTSLDEAVPNDVVLWNRLLVMAVVLGVADKVIDQLKVTFPDMLDDPYFYGYYWCYGWGYGRPFERFNDNVNKAHEIGSAALNNSSDGGGAGGGFSGGGGGGFGGGGGGGAF